MNIQKRIDFLEDYARGYASLSDAGRREFRREVERLLHDVLKYVKTEAEWDHATRDYEIGWYSYEQTMEAKQKELGL